MSKLSQFFGGGGIGPVGTLAALPLGLGNEFWFDGKHFLREGGVPYKDFHAEFKRVLPQFVLYGEKWNLDFGIGVPAISQNIRGIRYWWGPSTNKWRTEGTSGPASQLPAGWSFLDVDTCAVFGDSLYILGDRGVLKSHGDNALVPYTAPSGYNPKYIYMVGDSLVLIGDSDKWSVRASEIGDQSRWQRIPIQGGFQTLSAAPVPNKEFTLAVKTDNTVWLMHRSIPPRQLPGFHGRKLVYDGQRTVLCGDNQIWVWSNDTADPMNPAGYWYAPGFSWQGGDASLVDGKLAVMSGTNLREKKFIYSENFGHTWRTLQLSDDVASVATTSVKHVSMQIDDLIFARTNNALEYLVIRPKLPREIRPKESPPMPWALRLY